jgi:hypothetical protein
LNHRRGRDHVVEHDRHAALHVAACQLFEEVGAFAVEVDRDVRLAALLLVIGDERVFDRLTGDLGATVQRVRAVRLLGGRCRLAGLLFRRAVGFAQQELMILGQLALGPELLDVVGQLAPRIFAAREQEARRSLRLACARRHVLRLARDAFR